MKKAFLLAILIAVMSGCGNTLKDEIKGEKKIKVRTTRVQSVKDDYSLGYSGTVEASRVIPLSFKTVGTVDQIFVEVGDAVKKGQLLATLDDTDLQNIHDGILAKYQQAEDAYNRLKLVHDDGSLPDIKWVEMQSNLEQAKSSLDLAKNNLEKCRMLAPVDGIVGRRNIEPGQSSISLTSAPIELVKIETVFVKIAVPENEINRFSTGQQADVSVSALDGKTFQGSVNNISPVAELMSRTYTVKISVNNTDRDLKPGMVCDVRLDFSNNSAMIVVPEKAVSIDSEGNTYVFVVSPDAKTVKKQIVKVGKYSNAGIEVSEGLMEGQTIVSEGVEKLSDNSSISL